MVLGVTVGTGLGLGLGLGLGFGLGLGLGLGQVADDERLECRQLPFAVIRTPTTLTAIALAAVALTPITWLG